MFDELGERRSRWRVFWPEVDDIDGANEAIRLCCWFVFVAAALSGAAVVLGLPFGTINTAALANVLVMSVIGLGVRRKWRTVAVGGTVLQVVGIIVAVSRRLLPGVVDVFVLLALINGIRGTFAFATLSKAATAEAQAPSVSSSGTDLR
jgi:hypothetical protein